MLGLEAASGSAVESVAHIIQVALTPVFLLSGIASLLGVFAGRLARVADRVDSLTDELETAEVSTRLVLERRLAFLRRRSHALDVAVVLGACAGTSTCGAALMLFVGSLRNTTAAAFLYSAFGLALLCTVGALAAFLIEMLLASRGIRDHSTRRTKVEDAGDAEGILEEHPTHQTLSSPDTSSGGEA